MRTPERADCPAPAPDTPSPRSPRTPRSAAARRKELADRFDAKVRRQEKQQEEQIGKLTAALNKRVEAQEEWIRQAPQPPPFRPRPPVDPIYGRPRPNTAPRYGPSKSEIENDTFQKKKELRLSEPRPKDYYEMTGWPPVPRNKMPVPLGPQLTRRELKERLRARIAERDQEAASLSSPAERLQQRKWSNGRPDSLGGAKDDSWRLTLRLAENALKAPEPPPPDQAENLAGAAAFFFHRYLERQGVARPGVNKF